MLSDTLTVALVSVCIGTVGDYAAMYQGQVETSSVSKNWSTHPYWDNDKFQLGNICYDGNVYISVPMRYNILANQLIVLTPDARLPVIPNQQKIEWFELGGNRYEHVNGWFMRIEYRGDNASLLHGKIKRFAEDIVSDRRQFHNLVTIDRYYLRLHDDMLHEVKGFKSLCKAASAYRNELKQYKQEHHLGFWKSVRQTSLIRCTELLDSLIADKEPEVHSEEVLYVVPMMSTTTFDTLQTNILDAWSLPVYQAYSTDSNGNNGNFEFAEEENFKMSAAGISPLDVLSEPKTLEEIEVLGMRSKLSQQYSGVESFRPSLLRNIPLVMGEADVLKIAMKLPGVVSTGEVASGLNVRGGATEHTQMLYNGNTIFNPMHMFGLFSAFNPDLVAETELYKGSIPTQYGGRLSSVMNIKGKIPDRDEFHGSASIGLVTSKAVFEIPIIKDRMSLLLGGRATYSDWMLKLMPKKKQKNESSDSFSFSSSYYHPSVNNTSSYRDGKAGYCDLGGTLSAMLSQSHTLLVNCYHSYDRFSLTEYKKYAYGNINYSAELRSHYGNQLSTTITAGYDHYDYANQDTEFPTTAATLSFDLNQYFVKSNATYTLCEAHTLDMGVQGQYYNILPGSYQPCGQYSNIISRKLDTDQAIEGALWMEDTWSMSHKLKVTGGVRVNLFKSFKEGLETFNLRPDIRLSANYLLNESTSVKAGFNTLHQYIHKVSNTVIMSPTDIWMLSNSEIKPQSGWQASAGYYLQSSNGKYEFSAETYYKEMNNYLTYRNAAILVMNENLHKDVVGTKGRAYGIELQIRKLYGHLNGWLNYTYSRTELRQEKSSGQNPINGGHWFAADYDCPHNLKLVCNYKFTRRYSTSLNADYSTGRPFTAPIGIMPSETTGQYSVPIYSDRNTFRMPDYFRMDWSFNIEPSHHLTAKIHSWFTIGVYNILGRHNAYSIYFEGDGSCIRGYRMSIFGAPIPYINYNIKF